MNISFQKSVAQRRAVVTSLFYFRVMAKEYAKKFYKSKQWQACRDEYISNRQMIDGGMCEVCHKRLGYIIHHMDEITPQNIDDPEVTLNHENLIYVCHKCHDDIHLHDGRIVLFDDDGNLIGVHE